MRQSVQRARIVALGLITLSTALGVSCERPAASSPGPAGAVSSTEAGTMRAEVERVLAEQVAAWNAGDLDGFMRHYWRSPELRFASGENVQRGFDATKARYAKSYPDQAAMGTTRFEILNVDILSTDAVMVLGEWRLERDSGGLNGLFTLVLRRIEGAWKIVHDHTSKADS